tara:strand:- start:351 stop:1643 length:1293 start_codon:yes stop_codon:yes gene_type:complete
MAIKLTKRKKGRATPHIKRGDKLQAPKWEGWEEWTGEEFHRHKDRSRDFYYQNYKAADLYPHTYKWMAENGYSKDEITKIKAAPTHCLSITAGIIAKQLLDGMPDFNQKEDDYWQTLAGTMGHTQPVTLFLKEKIKQAIEAGTEVIKDRKEVAEKKAKVVPPLSIQERIREQAYVQSDAIEEWLEGFVINKETFDPKGFDFKKHFQKMNVTQAHARKLKTFYEGELDDFKKLLIIPTASQLKKMDEKEADDWEQLKEGYAHLAKADIKKYISAIENLEQALDFVIDSAKANRKPRKSKPKSASKLVEKLKYCKADEKFKVASITPEDIIKANELWVFNRKTRKIGKYIARNIDPQGQQRDGTGLSVKGTTIVGFDEEASIQKTLRKPEEQLKQFKDSGKVKLRTFLNDIKTTDTKLNGRCNPDTILLKVI